MDTILKILIDFYKQFIVLFYIISHKSMLWKFYIFCSEKYAIIYTERKKLNKIYIQYVVKLNENY